ncbi:MAG: aspartate--tRNA ligase [Bacilli bacterium]
MNKYKTHNCGELNKNNINEEVKIAGWLHNYRDHGGIIFLDIRDHYGITQVTIPEEDSNMKELAESIPKESAVSIKGIVTPRPDNMINPKLATGEIEINASEINILSKVEKELPINVFPETEVREDLRLQYRFLDLRREKVHNNIILRSKIVSSIRRRMTDMGFLEITTPILTASSPEGARDYLVPSRIHPGKFYALPQAPQQFKQLLMTSGFDKYFQIAPCFRDEDARADRSPGEFYQLDMEMAFATQDDIFKVMEKLLYELFSEFSNKKINKAPFPRIPFTESMLKYGTDKPDLRNPLEIKDVTNIFKKENLEAFKNKTVRVICAPNISDKPRKFFDDMIEFATENGAKGLAWLKVEENKLNGPIAKFISEEGQQSLISETDAKKESVMFFIADEENIATKLSGIIRTELANRLNLISKDEFIFCWIVDFPMFELNDEGKLDFSHNPFSMPQGGMKVLEEKNPLEILAYQYDIVCNGIELSSGAVRNHEPKTMVKAFEIAGYTKEVVENKFSALYNAFHYGAPPHAGIAPGVDRIVMLIADEPNIREIIAFPMNSKAEDLLMHAPNNVTAKQLKEIHIKLDE